jgi:hypothetical protein
MDELGHPVVPRVLAQCDRLGEGKRRALQLLPSVAVLQTNFRRLNSHIAIAKGAEAGCTYSKLAKEPPHIRLVTLNPGSWSDEIECSMNDVSFDKNPLYETISYVWGN